MAVEVSADSVIAKFLHKKLTTVRCEPTHASVTKAEKEVGANNLIAVPCPWGHQKGHLGLLQLAALYLQRNGAAFTLPAAAPPSYPVIPQGSTTAEREQLRAANEGDQQAWQTYLIVETKGVNQLAEAFDDVYYIELDNPDEGLCVSSPPVEMFLSI